MFQRIVEMLFIAAILAGGLFLWRSTARRGVLEREYARLEKKTGKLTIQDEAKIHIVVIPTGEPLHYAWRAYFPPNYRYAYTSQSGGGSGGMSGSWEGILRIRLRKIDGQAMLYDKLWQGSGLSSFGSPTLNKLMDDPAALERLLIVEQLGRAGVERIDPEQGATLLKLSFLKDALSDLESAENSHDLERLRPSLEHFRFGPPGFNQRPQP